MIESAIAKLRRLAMQEDALVKLRDESNGSGGEDSSKALELIDFWYSKPDEHGKEYWDELIQELSESRLNLSGADQD